METQNNDNNNNNMKLPNGRILVSAGWNDKTMKIWNAETFELRHKFEQEFNTNQLTIRNL